MFPRLRLLVEYAPLLAYAQDLAETDDPHDRAVIALNAAMWLAQRTDNTVDEHVGGLVKAVLASKEGEELFNYVVETVKGLMNKDA